MRIRVALPVILFLFAAVLAAPAQKFAEDIHSYAEPNAVHVVSVALD